MTFGKSNQAEVLLTNTDSYEDEGLDADLDGEEYDDEQEEDDHISDDDDDNSWVSDLKSSWKQHLVAALVAVAAAAVAFSHLQIPAKLTNPAEGPRHHHLNQYERMANVSFCTDKLTDASGLHSMEPLHVLFPQEMVESLIFHYRADMLQDDDYSKVLTADGEIPNEEFDCLSALSASQTSMTASTWTYQTPSIRDILNDTKAVSASISFTGFAAKFINLSPNPILLHWEGKGGHDDSSRLVAEIPPMEAVGTATTPGQGFFVSPVFDGSHALQRWTVTADTAIIVYENTDRMKEWKVELLLKFKLQKLNLIYARDYLVVTQRTWLAQFPRPPPVHHIWDARAIGQTHTITSDASHYISTNERLKSPLTLKLIASSVAPRVFEIDNFLSVFECQVLMNLANLQGLRPSTVASGSKKDSADMKTCSSTNAWIARDTSDIIDTIYRRAADVFNIDDSLLRHRSSHHHDQASQASIAESLQIVHYSKKQEYSPHHDFTYPSITNRYQPSRFATLLFYLNTVQQGGETTFPRSINGRNHDGLLVKPVMGKAVLFYNILPDGNLDDLSQHGSNPVEKGEKWIGNLWLWDPIID